MKSATEVEFQVKESLKEFFLFKFWVNLGLSYKTFYGCNLRIFVISQMSKDLTCGLIYKTSTIVIYDRNDSGQFYKTSITIVYLRFQLSLLVCMRLNWKGLAEKNNVAFCPTYKHESLQEKVCQGQTRQLILPLCQ